MALALKALAPPLVFVPRAGTLPDCSYLRNYPGPSRSHISFAWHVVCLVTKAAFLHIRLPQVRHKLALARGEHGACDCALGYARCWTRKEGRKQEGRWLTRRSVHTGSKSTCVCVRACVYACVCLCASVCALCRAGTVVTPCQAYHRHSYSLARLA